MVEIDLPDRWPPGRGDPRRAESPELRGAGILLRALHLGQATQAPVSGGSLVASFSAAKPVLELHKRQDVTLK